MYWIRNKIQIFTDDIVSLKNCDLNLDVPKIYSPFNKLLDFVVGIVWNIAIAKILCSLACSNILAFFF